MLQGRRTTPLPIPGPELERMRTTLAERYGSQVWEQTGTRVLVVRVPRAEPDMVKDIEEAVEILNPGDVQDLTHALLVGSERVHAVATQPFADLMSLRVQQDQKEAARWRPAMTRGTHQVVRLPHDVHRLQRLVLRLKCGKVAELDDEELDVWARELVPKMTELPYAAVRVVYLVADHDDVRLDADLFLQDLKARWQDTGLQERLASELVAKQEEAKRHREKDRASLLRDLRGRFPRVGTAPLTRLRSGEWEAGSPTPPPSPSPAATALSGPSAPSPEAPAQSPPIQTQPARPRSIPTPAPLNTQAPQDRSMYAAIDSLSGFVPSHLPATPRGARPPEANSGPTQPDLLPAQAETPSPGAAATAQELDFAPVDPSPPLAAPAHAPATPRSAPTVLSTSPVHELPAAFAPPAQPVAQAHAPAALRPVAVAPAPGVAHSEPAAAPPQQAVSPMPRPQPTAVTRPSAPAATMPGPAPPPVAPAVVAVRPEVLHLKAHLEARGFRVLVDPGVPGHALDLAAERTGGDIQRVVARFMPRLGDPEARALLETARALPVDLALAVAPEAEAGARRRFIATKARWIAPTDLDQLAL